jgi:hypothetical protein
LIKYIDSVLVEGKKTLWKYSEENNIEYNFYIFVEKNPRDRRKRLQS